MKMCISIQNNKNPNYNGFFNWFNKITMSFNLTVSQL